MGGYDAMVDAFLTDAKSRDQIAVQVIVVTVPPQGKSRMSVATATVPNLDTADMARDCIMQAVRITLEEVAS
ncbi:MAG: hypothetical protein EB084_22155 [Proteobacteria bacterium]|nr:hypothetical protein [Pseudomonadota bacterium]